MKPLGLTAVALCLLGQAACASSDESSLAASLELDHVYMYVPRHSTESAVVSALESAGLTVQPNRRDFGDGVLGRYVLFENAYLELLWYDGVTGTDEDSRKRAQWETSGASPFGVGMRRRPGVPDALPFPTRAFTAPWAKPGKEIRVLSAAGDVAGPDLFIVPSYMAHSGTGSHRLGIRRLSRVELVVRVGALTQAATLVSASRIAGISEGKAPAMILSFDGARTERVNLLPLLPITLLR